MSWAGWAHQQFHFRRVSWPSFEEGAEWAQITGGNVEMSAFSDLKVTATLDFDGVEAPDDRDLVRIYYSYTLSNGERIMNPLATLMFSVTEPKINGMRVSGSMDCQSLLSVLSSKHYGEPFTVKAGTQVVQRAINLAESLGLRVNNPDPSAYTLKSDHTFDADESNYLTIINWLLNTAGYSSAWVDSMGVIQFTPYVEPTERKVSITLADDKNSILMPELVKRSDYAETPNVVRLCYATDEETLTATATNVDESSRASLPVRGFEKTYFESISELDGDTQEERLANLESKAKQTLIDKSSDIEYVDGSCQYTPELQPNNALSIDYVRAGLLWNGALTNVKVSLSKGMPTDFSARRFIRSDLKISIDGKST